ncbi:unnamed protein product, partial [Onchocerca ochengi]
IQTLPPETVTSSSRINTLPILNEPVTIFSTDEFQRTSTDGIHDDEEIDEKMESERFISNAENNSSSTTLEAATTEYENLGRLEIAISEASRLENSESQRIVDDNGFDSTVGAIENTAGIMGSVNSHYISGRNDNSSVPFNSDYLASLILTSITTLRSALCNQQTESGIPENDILTSLLLNHALNFTETNHLMDNNRNGDMILAEDEATTQELKERLANLNAKIESLSYVRNNAI